MIISDHDHMHIYKVV